jgi:hypothetical protein
MIDEDLEKRVIEAMLVVRSLRFHSAVAKNRSGYRVNVRCDCGTKQVGSVHKSSKRPTFGDCLRELGRVIHQNHGPTTMPKDHSSVGARHARVCEGEDLDPSRVTHISW